MVCIAILPAFLCWTTTGKSASSTTRLPSHNGASATTTFIARTAIQRDGKNFSRPAIGFAPISSKIVLEYRSGTTTSIGSTAVP